MHINLEPTEHHAVQAYSEHKIQINSVIYEQSFIVSKNNIISDLTIKNINPLDAEYLKLLMDLQPELILIGYQQPAALLLPIPMMSQLSQQRIGIELMSLGAACRTYNLLLNENRAVVAGFILDKSLP